MADPFTVSANVTMLALSVELEVAGAGDVIVQTMGPVVKLNAFEEAGGAFIVAVEIHEVQAALECTQGFDLFQRRWRVGFGSDIDCFLQLVVCAELASFLKQPKL